MSESPEQFRRRLCAQLKVTEPQRGRDYFLSRTASEIAAIESDDAGWWLREFALARWSADTVFPAVIERRLKLIADMPEWQRGAA